MRDPQIEFPMPCQQSWDDMAPQGRSRHCGHCSTAVHDLSRYSAAEVEEFLRSGEAVCVRAKLHNDIVETRPNMSRRIWRQLITLAASLALLTGGGGAALAREKGPQGHIMGTATDAKPGTRVIASDGEGRIFMAKVQRDGRYKIKRVRPGTYDIVFSRADQAEEWSAGEVVVEANKAAVVNTRNPYIEIIVGRMSQKR